jgi:6-methylsalicylate decarboxylase
VIGAPIEDTITAVHLVRAGIPARFPNLQIILCHLGGALPVLLDRIDEKLGPTAEGTLPSHHLRRLWYDTVDHGSVPALQCATRTVGADRLLLGTDYPFAVGAALDRCLDHIRAAQLTEPETAGILGGHAAGLLAKHARLG